MRKAYLTPNFCFSLGIFMCCLLVLLLVQMEDSQALPAHHQKSWSFLKLWSCGIWPLSSGTQFKGMSFSEQFHLSSSAKNNHRERLYLKAKSHPQSWYHDDESLGKGASVNLILNICVGLVQISGLVQGNTHTH